MKNYGRRARRHGRCGKLINSFSGFYSGKKVFLTGHTGFKGSWLTLWLRLLGAKVTGFSLEPPTSPSLFCELGIEGSISHIIGDIRNLDFLRESISKTEPDVVLHLAAQPLVRLSYDQPIETFSTNVMGTANVLEAIRGVESVKACLCVTSDKCYENKEWPYAYRENDPMGGFDPYSASKGCSELVVSSFRRSFFPVEKISEHGVALATARAGNVIGGGDWALDRIFPDAVRALSIGKEIPIRSPNAIRPWQHVMEPLSGYLWLTAKMCESAIDFADAWNFGPFSSGNIPVKSLVQKIVSIWGSGGFEDLSCGQKNAPHEANFLKLDCSKASGLLDWRPSMSVDESIEFSAEWYRKFYCEKDFNARAFTEFQIKKYTDLAIGNRLAWAVHKGD